MDPEHIHSVPVRPTFLTIGLIAMFAIWTPPTDQYHFNTPHRWVGMSFVDNSIYFELLGAVQDHRANPRAMRNGVEEKHGLLHVKKRRSRSFFCPNRCFPSLAAEVSRLLGQLGYQGALDVDCLHRERPEPGGVSIHHALMLIDGRVPFLGRHLVCILQSFVGVEIACFETSSAFGKRQVRSSASLTVCVPGGSDATACAHPRLVAKERSSSDGAWSSWSLHPNRRTTRWVPAMPTKTKWVSLERRG